MTEKEFIVWLHGYLEIENPKVINENQTQIIKDHLNNFFKKVTPDRSSIKIDEHKIDIVADETMKEGEIKVSTDVKGRHCIGCGKWLGEGYICNCIFTRPSIEPYDPILGSCFICGKNHGGLSQDRLTVTC